MYKEIPASVTAFFRDNIPAVRYGRLTIDFIIINGQIARVDKTLTEQTKTNERRYP